MTYSPSPALVAAILSDEVYHNYSMTPPPGWVQISTPIDDTYSQDTGYYGEVWAQERTDPNNPGNFLSALNSDGTVNSNNVATYIVVNRGTVINAAQSYITHTTGQTVDLADTNGDDTIHTLAADAFIVTSQSTPSTYVNTGDALLSWVEGIGLNAKNSNIPVIVAGQSLGGYTSDQEAVFALTANDPNVSADTFNAWPFTESMATTVLGQPLTPQQEALIKNYYVGNELLTTLPGLGTPVGIINNLPDLPVLSKYTDFLTIHDTTSAISQLVEADRAI